MDLETRTPGSSLSSQSRQMKCSRFSEKPIFKKLGGEMTVKVTWGSLFAFTYGLIYKYTYIEMKTQEIFLKMMI